MRSLLLLIPLCAVFLLLAFVPTAQPQAADAVLFSLGLTRASEWEKETVTLPEREDASWKRYLAMQAESGYDMTPYCGMEAVKFRCRIGNHPEGENVYANLYLIKGKVIGGDIMSPALDGFMHGLKMPKQDSKTPFVMQMLQKNHI